MKTFIFGEAMLEYHSHGGSGLRYGGDTLNTAIHMARRGCDVAYVTALGTDPISDALVSAWQAEGIDTSFVLRHPHRAPGIYAIHLDTVGERSFLYWRDRSAARQMFGLPGMAAALVQARECDLLYFSLISLAVIGARARRALLNLAHTRKNAGRAVAYDSNYRAGLWSDPAEASCVSMRAIESATIGLPTNSDEEQLHGAGSEEDIAERWLEAGCREVVVKAGQRGCHCARADLRISIPSEEVASVDTSGAGDAFNAGYLHARLNGAAMEEAATVGQELARKTIGHFGAVNFGAAAHR